MARQQADQHSGARDPALEPTRAVPLYQAQTMARPAICDPASPVTRAYSTAMLAQLVPALRAAPLPAARPPVPRWSRWLALAAALALGAAAGAAAVAFLPPRATIDSTAGEPAIETARRTAQRAAPNSDEPPPRATTTTRAPTPPLTPAPAPASAGSDFARAAGSQEPASAPASAPAPRAAAELLARGRYREALSAYRALAQARPGQPAFAHVAAIVARRLARSCAQRDSAAGGVCTDDRT